MSGKNPFKLIEEENIREYQKKGPQKPDFLDDSGKFSIKTPSKDTSGPTFPSFQ